MLRKIVWCYILVLSLVDNSVKTKLSAHGKSHDASANGHDTLSDYSFTEEWIDGNSLQSPTDKLHKTFTSNKDASELLIQLDPPSLSLKQTYLGEAVKTTVTLTNLGQDTLHLASLAGNTPDFHASFFEHKMVPPGANTSFSVVFVGRETGAVTGALYAHTSRGVLRYTLRTHTWPSQWGLWPLHLRAPINASVRADLTLTNPTAHTAQVTQIYSSSSWLGMELVDGSSKEQWTIPPGATRTIARLVASVGAGGQHSAWVRVRGHHVPRRALLAVTAQQVPAGIYVQPQQIRTRVAGSHGPPAQTVLRVGNSSPVPVSLHHVTVTSRCSPQPHHPHNVTEGSAPGVSVHILKSVIDPHSLPQPAVKLTFNYAAMWTAYSSEHRDSAHAEGAQRAYCAGAVSVEGAALPYTVTLLAGGAVITPAHIHEVLETVAGAEGGGGAGRGRELRVRNEMPQPLRLVRLEPGPQLLRYFHMKEVSGGGVVVRAGGEVSFVELSLRADAPRDTLDSWIALHTNVSRYETPVLMFSGRLAVSWEWPVWEAGGPLSLGMLTVSSTKRVRGTLTSSAPRPLCVTDIKTELPGASVTLPACAHLATAPSGHACTCIEPYETASIVLTIVAPARPATIQGSVTIVTQHAATAVPVIVTAVEGSVRARRMTFGPVAPYVAAEAALLLQSSIPVDVRVVQVTVRDQRPPCNITLKDKGRVVYSLEGGCEPHCYTGLPPRTPPALQWWQRGARALEDPVGVLREDLILLEQRYKMFKPDTFNLTIYIQTTAVVWVPVAGSVQPYWPRLCGHAPPRATVGVGARGTLVVVVTNPSPSHSLLLQPVIAAPQPRSNISGSPVSAWCERERCAWRPSAFRYTRWQGRGEGVTESPSGDGGAPLLLLPPKTIARFTISFQPDEEKAMTATLYLRNNLTVVEVVPLDGEGCVPKLQLTPPSALVFEVSECARVPFRRLVRARNTGSTALSLRGWWVSGQPCSGRGFAVEPCGPLLLQPNESATLTLIYVADYSLALVSANLTVQVGESASAVLWFELWARTPTWTLGQCQVVAWAPWEGWLRRAGVVVAGTCVVLVLLVASHDADRLLRVHRARVDARRRPPLDLRAVAAERVSPPPAAARAAAPPPPPPPRRRARRRHDAAAEGRAFDTWRASLHRSCEPEPTAEADECSEPRDSPDDESTTSSELSSAPPDHEDHEEQEDNEDHEDHEEQESANTSDDSHTHHQQSSDSNPPRSESPPPAYSTVEDSPTRRRRRDRRANDDRPPRTARHTRPSQPKRRVTPTAAVSHVASVTPPIPSETSSSSSSNTSARYTSWSSVVVGAGGSVAPSRAPPPPTHHQPPPPPDTPTLPPSRPHDSLFYFNGTQDQYKWPECNTYDTQPMAYETVSQPPPPYEARHSPYEGGHAPYEGGHAHHMQYGPAPSRPSPTLSAGTASPDRRPFAARTQQPEEPCIKSPVPVRAVGPVKAPVGAVGQPANVAGLTSMGNLATSVSSVGPLGNMNTSSLGTLGNVSNVGPLPTSVARSVNVGAIGSGSYSWGGLEARAPGAGWGYMRPPPGFAPPAYAPPAPQPQPPPARPFDPFQSLAAIWTRTALDWGAEDVDEQRQ